MALKDYVQLLTLLATSWTVRSDVYPSEMVSGLYPENVYSPIFYESFIPIIFEYNYPSWSQLDVTLRDWRGMCQSDDFAPSYTCPVFFYLERFIERMQTEIAIQTTRGFARQVAADLHNITDPCNRIQIHFHSLLTKKASVENYLRMLKSCPVQGHESHRAVNDYVYSIKNIYQQMVAKFEREFSSKMGTVGVNDRFGPAYYVNQITSAQGLMMFNYWVEHTRWETAAHTCAQQMIPTTLIKPANLTASLKKVEDEAAKQRYVLSIPINETGIYLMSSLADCTYTDASTFLVRILVPVKKKSAKPKLVKLHSVPFILNDNNGVLSVCEIFDAAGHYIYDEISGYLVESHCGSEDLCQLDDPSRMTIPNLCASAYFSGSIQNIKSYCDFQCERIVDGLYPLLPIFSRVASDKIVVTGNVNLELVVKCEGQRDQIVNPDQLGSLEITLPCQCTLNFRSTVFHPEQPCGSNLSIKVILPVHFFSDAFIISGGNFTGNFSGNMMSVKYFQAPNDTADSIIPIQRDVETGREEAIKTEASELSQPEAPVSSSKTSSASISWLWALFIIQTICVFACLFLILKKLDFAPWTSLRSHGLRFSNPVTSVNSVSTENIVERANKTARITSSNRNEEPFPV